MKYPQLDYLIFTLFVVFVVIVLFVGYDHGRRVVDSYGVRLDGECFVSILQRGYEDNVGMANLSSLVYRRQYVYSIGNGTCGAMYSGCRGLYSESNIRCVLRGNVCDCREEGA